jgi:ABC-type bacteriocin/lantibiotic exporter with double-glycine peptidase domain
MDQVQLGVDLVPQHHDMTCWAASMAMVVNARDGSSLTDDDVVAQTSSDDNGKTWDEAAGLASVFNLVQVGPACWTPDGWADVLNAHGAIWTPEPGNQYHIVVVAGIQGDGTPEGSAFLIYDPWPPNGGNVYTPSYSDFEQQYELGEGYGAQLLAGW